MEGKIVFLYPLIIILDLVCTNPRIVPKLRAISSEETEDGHYDNKQNEENAADRSPTGSRSLAAGDTFTPMEMLPIAQKLIAKVENLGVGKGIVSSSKNDQDLADRLFHGFFLSPKRIVTLEEYDIIGIDALQALALHGDVASPRYTVKPQADEEKNKVTVSFRGQTIHLNNDPKSAKFKLVTKAVPYSILRKVLRRGTKLAEKLGKNRVLVVKSGRKHSSEKNKKATAVDKRHTNFNNNNILESNATCHWRYECKNPGDLDTCTLQTTCMKTNDTKRSIPQSNEIYNEENRNSAALKYLRKKLGISIIDEEVEKILETRVMHNRPQNLESSERIESLGEYFQNIIMAKHESEITTAMPIKIKHVIKEEKSLKDDQDQNTKLRLRLVGIPARRRTASIGEY